MKENFRWNLRGNSSQLSFREENRRKFNCPCCVFNACGKSNFVKCKMYLNEIVEWQAKAKAREVLENIDRSGKKY